jgi:hypothetical protein
VACDERVPTLSADNEARLRRNAESKSMADNDREQWTVEEVEFLMSFFVDAKGDDHEEAEVAHALGRTIEACRQRFYEVRSGKRHVLARRRTSSTTTTTVTEYIGHFDDPEDQWWSPVHFNQEDGGSHA